MVNTITAVRPTVQFESFDLKTCEHHLLQRHKTRKLCKKQAKKFYTRLKNGEWMPCFAKLHFLENGQLLNGQHLLHAAISYLREGHEEQVEFLVIKNAPLESLKYMDIYA